MRQAMRRARAALLAVWSMAGLSLAGFAADGVAPTNDADDSVAAPSASAEALLAGADRPVVYFRLQGAPPAAIQPDAASTLALTGGEAVGGVAWRQAGPRSPRYPLFAPDAEAAVFDGRRAFVRYADPGDNSPLDFDHGDEITLEAWVNPAALTENQQVYIVGKGRTKAGSHNQNYALRLRCVDGLARVSFLFRSQPGEGQPGDYHRWNSQAGFAAGSGWHHVAVTYRFGEPDSIRGYVDGRPTGGSWDMAGPTAAAPVVDNDELWIGAALGGSASNTFHGGLAEIAIHRGIVPAERLQARYKKEVELARLPPPPSGVVLVEIIEGLAENSWELPADAEPSFRFTQEQLALVDLPKKYAAGGVIADRRAPLLVRARMRAPSDGGQFQLLLRSLGAARLYIDDQLVAQTGFAKRNASGHEPVPPLDRSSDRRLRPLSPGHQQQRATIELAAGEHEWRLEALVGGKGIRPEVGELSVALDDGGGQFVVVAADNSVASGLLSDDGWKAVADDHHRRIADVNAQERRRAAAADDDFWRRRHELARRLVAERGRTAPPANPADYPLLNPLDSFLNARLAAAGQAPRASLDDYAFLRRLALDTVGVNPTPAEIDQFLSDPADVRRERAIDRYLADPRWADHWVSYWQDVLAENPGILKPELNNTGPFRFWIHDALADNKPLDRFATELLLMAGSRHFGGPAGFAVASQNDSPMAAKAHVAGQAFLAVEMKCARCHDAPYHPYSQQDLFSVAAMLDRKPQTLLATSTVPVTEGGRQPLVEISLKPGDKIQPVWPFADFVADDDLTPLLMRNPNDLRERLAALITSPAQTRFPQVLANRVWRRLMGVGLVEPVDDWHDASISHPELLAWLGDELATNGYDLRRLARLILTSHAYQRQVDGELATAPADARLFAGPARRRLTAEQLVDTLFAAAGKPLDSEALTFDPENRRPADSFLNLGEPRRAWEFVSMANERDRPALALPVAQTITDLLVMFGWRESRQNPLTVRDDEPTLLQPLTLGNGVVGGRIATLSDDSALTELALAAGTVDELIDDVLLRVLARPANSHEQRLFGELLAPGFETRATGAPPLEKPRKRFAVSWSNHLSPEATEIKMELELLAQQGDPPTPRLESAWRERLEDVVWSLVNSPEFVFAP